MKFKEIFIDEGTVIYLTMYRNIIIALGNAANILDVVQEEIDNYMTQNNLESINIITSNDFDVFNYEKTR